MPTLVNILEHYCLQSTSMGRFQTKSCDRSYAFQSKRENKFGNETLRLYVCVCSSSSSNSSSSSSTYVSFHFIFFLKNASLLKKFAIHSRRSLFREIIKDYHLGTCSTLENTTKKRVAVKC